jgi:hypothetical protein
MLMVLTFAFFVTSNTFQVGLTLTTSAHLVGALGRGTTIDWRQLIAAGMRLPTPTPDDILGMCRRNAGRLTRAQFVEQTVWFDDGDATSAGDESGEPRAYSRARGCKELLFDLLSDVPSHDGSGEGGGGGGDVNGSGAGQAVATVSMSVAATWLCKMDDSVLALRTAIAVAMNKLDAPVSSDAPIDLDAAVAALNYDATASSATSFSNPVSRVSLTALWAESNSGKCTVNDLVNQHPEIAHYVETRFGRIDLRRHSNLVL